jgi:sulfur-oxidizing protein SoxB
VRRRGFRSIRARSRQSFYDAALKPFGNLSLLHVTDVHAQLRPVRFREPSVNLGIGEAAGKPPHLVGEALLRHFGIRPGTREAHAFTYLDFERASRTFGTVGGYAHLATLVKQLRASRPGALLLDGGDCWQGSATSLWTKGQDMIDAQKLLGVDVMTGHWEFTYGAERVKQVVERDFAGKVDFRRAEREDDRLRRPVFEPYVIRQVNGVPVAIVGQAFPYTPIANPRYFVPEWTFGIQEQELQKVVDEARGKGAAAVVLLSHNGMDVDLKLASRVTGIDAILGGHTHDGVPQPTIVANRAGRRSSPTPAATASSSPCSTSTCAAARSPTSATGSCPVFSELLPADREMDALIAKHRAPFDAKLNEALATTETLLYRRGNFNGTFDQVICDALRAEKDAPIAFSPGFRWGPTLLPGETIRREHLMDQTAVTYPYTTVSSLSGETIKTILEDVADNLFNPDPYYQQGGDMVRVGGLAYTIDPEREAGIAHLAHDARRQASRGGQELQGRRLGAGVGEARNAGRRADLGRGRAVPEAREDRARDAARDADGRRHARQRGDGAMTTRTLSTLVALAVGARLGAGAEAHDSR